ncbi:MAG TPA: hypothetical protein PKX87_05840, partial [Alphaproteobacteria bacterium]|nr:hypothetical protein [Alphaproteobacteria bacterium]
KGLPRALRREFPDMAQDYREAFECAFQKHDDLQIIKLAKKILAPQGGTLLHYGQKAPEDWRKWTHGP